MSNSGISVPLYFITGFLGSGKTTLLNRVLDEATAQKMIREVDRSRELYHRHYCPEVKDPFTDHDIMLDSSFFGVEGSAKLLAHIARERFAD